VTFLLDCFSCPDPQFLGCEFVHTFCVIFCGLRLCYAQSHSDNSHMHTAAQTTFYMCTCSGSPHKVMNSSS